MNGRGRQIVLTLLLGVLPAVILVLTFWLYDLLDERMRVDLHTNRSHLLRLSAVEIASGSARNYPVGFLADNAATITSLIGDWPGWLDAAAIRGFNASLGSATEHGVPIEGKGLEPSFLWIIPVGSGSRVAVQSRRQFYGRRESLRGLIWTGGLLLVGVGFALFVMVGRKLSDVFAETEAKNLELERANRHLEELGTLKSNFLALVSHELRTPLARMAGQMELLKPLVEALPPEVGRRLQEIAVDVEELNRMTKNVLDLTRLQSEDLAARMTLGQIGPLVMGRVERIRSMATVRGLELTVETPDAPPVNHDTYLLERILDNLLINAVKYSPDGGWLRVRLVEKEHVLEIQVENHGPVIAALDREKVFEKFHRLEGGPDVPGTGLGLYLVRQFILMMGGRAWVEPVDGGNRFVVTLPL